MRRVGPWVEARAAVDHMCISWQISPSRFTARDPWGPVPTDRPPLFITAFHHSKPLGFSPTPPTLSVQAFPPSPKAECLPNPSVLKMCPNPIQAPAPGVCRGVHPRPRGAPARRQPRLLARGALPSPPPQDRVLKIFRECFLTVSLALRGPWGSTRSLPIPAGLATWPAPLHPPPSRRSRCRRGLQRRPGPCGTGSSPAARSPSTSSPGRRPIRLRRPLHSSLHRPTDATAAVNPRLVLD